MTNLSSARQRTIQLQQRTFDWMCGVLKACPKSVNDIASRELWRQLVRAALGSAGNLEEADEASSTRDFISKMKIALRETKESHVWLRALRACKLTGHERMEKLEDEARQLSLIFAKIVVKTKRRQKAEREQKRMAKRASTKVGRE